ncbi:MAG: hypothetical protein ACFB2X_13080 [Rivularia sp. (in: cyanobacteria)]
MKKAATIPQEKETAKKYQALAETFKQSSEQNQFYVKSIFWLNLSIKQK